MAALAVEDMGVMVATCCLRVMQPLPMAALVAVGTAETAGLPDALAVLPVVTLRTVMQVVVAGCSLTLAACL